MRRQATETGRLVGRESSVASRTQGIELAAVAHSSQSPGLDATVPNALRSADAYTTATCSDSGTATAPQSHALWNSPRTRSGRRSAH